MLASNQFMRLILFFVLACCCFAQEPRQDLTSVQHFSTFKRAKSPNGVAIERYLEAHAVYRELSELGAASPRFADGCSATDVGLGSVVEAGLAAADCQVRDFYLTSSGRATSRVKAYTLNVRRAIILNVELTSSQFDPYLYLLDKSLQLIATDDNTGGGKNARLYISVPAGTYTVLATSAVAAGVGDFRLAASSEEMRMCRVEKLGIAQNVVDGRLGDSDCRFMDVQPFSRDDAFVDYYTVEIPRRGVLTVDMSSPEVNSFVAVLDKQDTLIAADNDSGGNKNARLLVGLAPGTYKVLATSYATETGNYKLNATFEDPRPCTAMTASLGDKVAAEFVESDCRILDLFTGTDDSTYVHRYRLDLKQATLATVTMRSKRVDAYLELYDAQMMPVDSNDDFEDATSDAQIATSLNPGIYYLLASEADVSTGLYEVSSSAEPLRVAVFSTFSSLHLSPCRSTRIEFPFRSEEC